MKFKQDKIFVLCVWTCYLNFFMNKIKTEIGLCHDVTPTQIGLTRST